MSDTVKFPYVHVQLTGEDGNAFFILSRVARAMKKVGIPAADVSEYQNKAMSGDYNNLLLVTAQTVSVS